MLRGREGGRGEKNDDNAFFVMVSTNRHLVGWSCPGSLIVCTEYKGRGGGLAIINRKEEDVGKMVSVKGLTYNIFFFCYCLFVRASIFFIGSPFFGRYKPNNFVGLLPTMVGR